MKPWLAIIFCCCLSIGCGPKNQTETATPAEGVESAPVEDMIAPSEGLIPREVLFGNPERTQARISPDGKWLSFLAPLDGVMNVYVAPIDAPDKAEAITADTGRGIRRHLWSYASGRVLYVQDKGGDENWRVYSASVETREVVDLTPIDGVQARIIAASPRHPDHVLISLNDRVPQLHDVYRVNLATGERALELENDGFLGFTYDQDYNCLYAIRQTPEGGMEWLEPGDDGWQLFQSIPMNDVMTSGIAAITADGSTLYYLDSRDRNTGALVAFDTKTRKSEVIAEDARADIDDVMIHPETLQIQAWSSTYERREWRVLDPSIQPDLDKLATVSDGEIEVVSRTQADDRWVVAYEDDDGPVRYYLYDRPTGEAAFLFAHRSDLEDHPLAPMTSHVIQSRDGKALVSYLTRPVGAEGPTPMVLLVHGGPWARDSWGYNSYHQWLANRGYAVLSVNFRGSTGLGKDFTNAANGQWSGTMHNDLLDAVEWAIAEKITWRENICIMGGSYGGYATLVGLTFTPEVFACGIDIVGPSNLATLLESVPEYWKPMLELLVSRIADHRTEEGKAKLRDMSPLHKADAIVRPLLIAQGANDPRVKQAESDQIVSAMQASQIPVTYVLFPDEGHGFARPENDLSFTAVAEAFLARHLGGEYQAVGDDFEGSSITVPTGAEFVPGLPAALE